MLDVPFFNKDKKQIKMTPLQKDPKQLWTIKKIVAYKNGLKDTRY